MALKVVSTQEITKDVNFLEDVKVKFVSLVKHGANREPFKIIKREGGKMSVIQSILLPKDKSLSDLANEEGLKWLTAVKTDSKAEKDSYVEYVQHPAAKFKTLSEPQPIGKTGVSLVLGTLKDDKEKDNLLTAPANIMGTVLAYDPITFVPGGWTAGELLYNQIDSLLSVIQGSLSQTALGPEEQKTTILTAAQAFERFIEQWITALGGQANSMMKTELLKFLDERLAKNKTTNGGESEMNAEEIRALLKEENAPLLERLEKLEKAEPATKEEPVTEPTVADAIKEALGPVAEMLKAQGEELKALAEARKADDEKAKADAEKAKYVLVADPKVNGQDAGESGKVKSDDGKEKADKFVFTGAIFNTNTKQIGLNDV